jgi:hypothetical protein
LGGKEGESCKGASTGPQTDSAHGSGIEKSPRYWRRTDCPAAIEECYCIPQEQTMKQVLPVVAAVFSLSLPFIGFGQDNGRPGLRFPPDLVAATLTVNGISHTAILSEDDLSNLPQRTVTTADHGTEVTFQGVLLADLLAKVDLPTGDKFHSTAASYYLLAEGHDGYGAVFSWAEVDSSFMDKPVYVVMKRDGKPLSEKDGPFELVVPGEKRNARWVRQLIALRVRRAG